MDYGVEVQNKFELVLEDEDPYEVLKQIEESKKKAKEDAKNGKNVKTDKSKSAKNKQTRRVKVVEIEQTSQNEQSQPKREDRPQRDNQSRRGNRGDADNRPARFQDENRPPRYQRLDQERREAGFGGGFGSEFRDRGNRDLQEGEGGFAGGRGGFGRGGRGGRGRGRGRGAGGFGKREYDRHSGSDKTGVKAVDKKDGGGAHNWGTFEDEVSEQMNTSNVSDDQEVKPEEAEKTDDAANTSGDAVEDAEPEEEPVKELTLDEYKAQMATNSKPKLDLTQRKANEGCNMDQWKTTHVLKKSRDWYHESDEEEYESDEEDVRGRQKTTVPIEIKFADSRRGAPRGGGRGRGRGGRDGEFGGGRGGRDGEFSGGRGGRDGEFGGGRGGRGGEFRGGRGGRGGESGGGRGRGFGGGRGGGRRDDRGKESSAPNVENPEEFPSLGGT